MSLNLLKSFSRRYIALVAIAICSFGFCSSSADAALVFEYNATGDDGDGTWVPVVNGAPTAPTTDYDWNLAGQTFGPAGSSYTGITSAFDFSGTNSGGSNQGYGFPTADVSLPLGPTRTNAAGASSTWEIWVKPDQTTLADIGNEVILESGGTTNGHTLTFRERGGNDGVDLVYHARSNNATGLDFDGGDANAFTVTQQLTDESLLNDFMQLVVVVDSENDLANATPTTRIFLNGQLLTDVAGWQPWQRGAGNGGLGRDDEVGGGDNFSGRFDGSVALVRLYDTPLSDQDVLNNFNAIVGSTGGGNNGATPEPTSVVLALLAVTGLSLSRPRRQR